MRAFGAKERFDVKLVHTGQHYDDALSKVFFDELGIPRPDIDLGVGSGTHTQQTASVMTLFEKVLEEEQPQVSRRSSVSKKHSPVPAAHETGRS